MSSNAKLELIYERLESVKISGAVDVVVVVPLVHTPVLCTEEGLSVILPIPVRVTPAETFPVSISGPVDVQTTSPLAVALQSVATDVVVKTNVLSSTPVPIYATSSLPVSVNGFSSDLVVKTLITNAPLYVNVPNDVRVDVINNPLPVVFNRWPEANLNANLHAQDAFSSGLPWRPLVGSFVDSLSKVDTSGGSTVSYPLNNCALASIPVFNDGSAQWSMGQSTGVVKVTGLTPHEYLLDSRVVPYTSLE